MKAEKCNFTAHKNNSKLPILQKSTNLQLLCDTYAHSKNRLNEEKFQHKFSSKYLQINKFGTIRADTCKRKQQVFVSTKLQQFCFNLPSSQHIFSYGQQITYEKEDHILEQRIKQAKLFIVKSRLEEQLAANNGNHVPIPPVLVFLITVEG